MSLFVGNLAFINNLEIYGWCKDWCSNWFFTFNIIWIFFIIIFFKKMINEEIIKLASNTEKCWFKR